jgi:hypothetical protein
MTDLSGIGDPMLADGQTGTLAWATTRQTE